MTGTTSATEQEAAPVDPQVAHLRAAVRRLRRREVVLRHRLDVARWKLAKLEARRSTRLVQAVGAALGDPRALIRLPVTLLSILRRHVDVPPRPTESAAVAAAEEALATSPRSAPRRPAGAPPPRQRPRLTPPDLVDAPFPTGPVARPGLRVVTILDEFSARAFAYEAALHPLRPESWRQTLDEVRPHLLLVESAWRGVDDTWRHHLTPPTPPSDALRDLVAECRRRGIPTVFWNKEDPPNFDLFIDSAALFDTIFTVDEGSVARYRERLGHDRVHVLPFAAQPRLHHPLLTTGDRDHAVAFAGTYYVDKHPHRKVQMMQVLEPARPFELHIYARFGTSRAYRFPPPLDEHVVGRLTYAQTLDAYRRYRVFLNVNSAPKSSTMCARRIFELLACGATVVSGVSPAIERLLGPGLVAQSDDPDRTTELLQMLLGDDDERARRSARGTRAVLAEHTYSDRFATILSEVGLDAADPTAGGRLSVVVPADDASSARRLLAELGRQRRQPDEIVVAGEQAASVLVARDAAAAPVRSADVPARRPVAAARACTGDLVAILDPAAAYGPSYLLDQELAFRYAGVAAVGKAAHLRYEASGAQLVVRDAEHEHRSVRSVRPGSLVVRRDALEAAPDIDEESALIDHVGGTDQLVSTSRFEFVRPTASEPIAAADLPSTAWV